MSGYLSEHVSDNSLHIFTHFFFPSPSSLCLNLGQNELGCEINGRRLEEGQVFQPSCAQLCQCFGGGMTCMPLCSSDLQRPVDKCPNPQLVRPPGRCCKEWVCDSLDNSISSNPSTGNGLACYKNNGSWKHISPCLVYQNNKK